MYTNVITSNVPVYNPNTKLINPNIGDLDNLNNLNDYHDCTMGYYHD